MLIFIEEEKFWEKMRLVIREEIQHIEKQKADVNKPVLAPTALTSKPLLKLSELCKLLKVSRTTIYEWIKKGTLKQYKIRSRVYFLWDDVQNLLNPTLKE